MCSAVKASGEAALDCSLGTPYAVPYEAIQSGHLRREEHAVKEAISLWEVRERARAKILAAVDEAESSIARGEGRTVTPESMRELAASVKRRGRARLSERLD
jgi:hypothetical protein